MSFPGHSIRIGPKLLNACIRLFSVTSHGTPPRKILLENTGCLCFLGGSCPDHVHVDLRLLICASYLSSKLPESEAGGAELDWEGNLGDPFGLDEGNDFCGEKEHGEKLDM